MSIWNPPKKNIFGLSIVNIVLEQDCIKIILYKVKEAIWSEIYV